MILTRPLGETISNEPHSDSLQTPTNQNSTVFPDGLQAVALYQHRGKSDDELSFNKNDIITLKEQKDMSWLGECNGKVCRYSIMKRKFNLDPLGLRG